MADLEEWKPVLGYESLYEVSNLGNVRSLVGHNNFKRIKVLAKHLLGCGDRPKYYAVYLYNRKGQRQSIKVHRLVAQAFIPNTDNLPCVNHKDENTLNNDVSNLEWCTKLYNVNYGTARTRAADKHKKRVAFYKDDTLQVEFDSVIQAAEHFGVSPQSIARVARGVRKSFHGMIVKYI